MSQLKMVSPFLTTNSSACTHDPFRGVRVFPVRFLHPYLSSKLTSHPLISVHSRRFSGSLLSSAQCPLSSIMGISQMGCSQKVGGRDMCSAKFAGITVPMLSAENQLVHDIVMSVLTASVVLALLRFWDEMAKRNMFHPTLNRKFVHISIGLVFLLFWPLFSTGPQAPYLAALAPGVNIFRMIGLGLGILKNEAMVKSMSRHGNARELLKGPLYYACTLTFVTILFWRTSPIGPVAIANLCAGDGCADIAGRRLGTIKLPYNKNKSFAGSFTMLIMGSTASIGYLFYFAFFGYYDVNLKMLLAALLVSIAATLTESLPISTELDDNLTVSLVSAVVGCLVF